MVAIVTFRPSDHQVDLVARLSTHFGGLACEEICRTLERQLFPFHDVGISHTVPCASYREPDTVRRSWWINHAQKGRVTSGRGRSEMSSSGNASLCICVRMSPGSTVTTEIPSGLSSAANVFETRSSPALLDP